MKRMYRATAAPLGMVLLLSVLTIPVSLRAVGMSLDLSPRIKSVGDAWGQVAGVFVNQFHPSGNAQLMVLGLFGEAEAGAVEEPPPAEEATCSSSLLACAGKIIEEVVIDEAADVNVDDSGCLEKARSLIVRPSPRSAALVKRRGIARDSRYMQAELLDVEPEFVKKALVHMPVRSEDIMRLVEARMADYKLQLTSGLKSMRAPRVANVYVSTPATAVGDCDEAKRPPLRPAWKPMEKVRHLKTADPAHEINSDEI